MEMKLCKVPFGRTLERARAEVQEYRLGWLLTVVVETMASGRRVNWETGRTEVISFHAAEGGRGVVSKKGGRKFWFLTNHQIAI
jgi:hypothetical protein